MLRQVSFDAGLGGHDWMQAVADHFEQGNVSLAATALILTWSAERGELATGLVGVSLSSYGSADERREAPGVERQNRAVLEALIREGFVARTADGWLLRTP